MTQGSIREYTEAVRERYMRASKKEKGRVLDEFTAVVGCQRKSAIRLLRGRKQSWAGRRRGRPRRYGHEVAGVLKMAWEATDRLCSKRLHPFLPELIPVLRRHGDSFISAEVADELCRMSPSTMDRLLRPWRRLGRRRPLSTTKPGSLLKSSIPIRTFADWEEARPGFLEVDLVSSCNSKRYDVYCLHGRKSKSNYLDGGRAPATGIVDSQRNHGAAPCATGPHRTGSSGGKDDQGDCP